MRPYPYLVTLIVSACVAVACGNSSTNLQARDSGSGSGGEGGAAAGAGPLSTGPIAELCDGSDGVRLDYRLVCPLRYAPGTDFLHINGDVILLVHGDCHYTLTSSRYEFEVRTGQLDAGQAKQLAADARYGQWVAPGGEWRGGTADGCGYDLSDGMGSRLQCLNGCGEGPGPRAGAEAQVADLAGKVADWPDRLRAQAKPIDGPMRIGAVALSPRQIELLPNLMPVFLGLTVKLADFAVDPSQENLAGQRIDILVEDAEDLAKLRSIRQRALNGEFPSYESSGTVFVSDDPEWQGGAAYWFYFRDVLPEENADGTLPRPGE